MNPNVQVALVSVLATFVTTIGVVLVAMIENRKEQRKTRRVLESGVMPGYDEKSFEEVLETLMDLLQENERKDIKIMNLKKRNRVLSSHIHDLQTQLRLKENYEHPSNDKEANS